MAFGWIRSTTRRRWSWLVSLGLLFAFAQAAANAHAISHLGKDANGQRESALVHAQCDLCLIGAAIGGAAPLPELPPMRHPPLVDVAIDVASVPFRDVAPALAYRSRAPPAAQR
jgi:hypothetical protein